MKPYRVIASLPEADLAPIHYRRPGTAIAGAVRLARLHPHSHVTVERLDQELGRYVRFTQTQGAATR